LAIHTVLSSGPVDSDRFEGTSECAPNALRLLDVICKEADAGVIVCSRERLGQVDANWWTAYFRSQGARHVTVVGLTPAIHDGLRGYEVLRFRESSENAGNYVVIDATGIYLDWQPVIKVDFASRISERVAYEALRQLNPDSPVLREWESAYGYGDLLTLFDPATDRFAA
jgi:hypothetical protein